MIILQANLFHLFNPIKTLKLYQIMKSRIYYITYVNKDNFTVTKPIIATSEKNAMKIFNMTGNAINKFIKIGTEII